MPEISGGGYQYPKACLDPIGKRYVVETGQTENGWFIRYSDGWIEQGGVTNFPIGGTQIQLPIAFSTTDYVVNATRTASNDGNIPFARASTESAFIGGTKERGGSTAGSCNWMAFGY